MDLSSRELDQGILSFTWLSLKLVAQGYVIALLVGTAIGFFLGLSKTFCKMFDPIFQVCVTFRLSHGCRSAWLFSLARLFEDGRFFTVDGRARFLFEEPRKAPEQPDEEYPFLLLTGRGTSSQWHTNTRTGKSDVLRKLYPKDCYVEINPRDAQRLRIRRNFVVRISSRRAAIRATAFVTPTVQAGQLFIPMHYREVNQLTLPVFDSVLAPALLQGLCREDRGSCKPREGILRRIDRGLRGSTRMAVQSRTEHLSV